jgi:hypothetical protein
MAEPAAVLASDGVAHNDLIPPMVFDKDKTGNQAWG